MVLHPSSNFYDTLGLTYEKVFAHDTGLLTFITTSLSLRMKMADTLRAPGVP